MSAEPASLISEFCVERVLNQDQAGRRICIYGTIRSQPALLTLERAPFSPSPPQLARSLATLTSLSPLGANDIYFWYLASSAPAPLETDASSASADLKINLIYPCTEQHVKKYSQQGVRMVTETPQLYRQLILPYIQRKRDEGRLNWVWNIIDGKTEAEDVIYRTPLGHSGDEGFLILPDLNWDRKTKESLHLLGLVERRDIWSLRDLKKKHLTWLKQMRDKLIEATVKTYEDLEPDQLKLYVHYQPTYYHFHIHLVHVALEAGGTQAVGKAIGLNSIIEQLEHMEGDQDQGMGEITLSYTIGEASELWTEVFEPLKKSSMTTDKACPPHLSGQQ